MVEEAFEPVDPDVFSCEELSGELRHGEILTGINQHVYDIESEAVTAERHSFALVSSQDCDLLQDFNARKTNSEGQINSVLLFAAQEASITRSTINGSDLWKRVWQNQEYRYHYLEAVKAEDDALGLGLPALVVDFRHLFALPMSDVYKQLALGVGPARRCRLQVSYREHFQMRAAFFLQRVMLPRQHNKPIF